MSNPLRTLVIAVAALTLPATVAVPAVGTTTTSSGEPVTNAAGQTFRVLAHRGGLSQWPENSVLAYQGAAAAGYDGIETDIAFTADGVAVMSHYDKLPSRCTLAGSKIHTMNWTQVQQVLCNDLSGQPTVPIPTFAELATVLRAHPEVSLTLDIKTYTGQTKAGRVAYATKAVKLVKDAGLLERTRFLSFNFDVALPAIRKLAPKAYVLAYDHNGFDYDRVRLAAKLGASGYGTQARYTSVNLATFIRSKGLEMVPWEVTTTQAQAMSIRYGPRTFYFMTDAPGSLTTSLVSGSARLDWTATDEVTPLATPITVVKKTYRAKRTYYPQVLGNAVPTARLAALKTVNLAITITKGASKNYLYAAARSSAASSTQKVTLPKGTGTILVSVPVGDGGKLRLRTSKKSKLTVAVVSYTNEIYAATPNATAR